MSNILNVAPLYFEDCEITAQSFPYSEELHDLTPEIFIENQIKIADFYTFE